MNKNGSESSAIMNWYSCCTNHRYCLSCSEPSSNKKNTNKDHREKVAEYSDKDVQVRLKHHFPEAIILA